jgi:hypothetical protein
MCSVTEVVVSIRNWFGIVEAALEIAAEAAMGSTSSSFVASAMVR